MQIIMISQLVHDYLIAVENRKQEELCLKFINFTG